MIIKLPNLDFPIFAKGEEHACVVVVDEGARLGRPPAQQTWRLALLVDEAPVLRVLYRFLYHHISIVGQCMQINETQINAWLDQVMSGYERALGKLYEGTGCRYV